MKRPYACVGAGAQTSLSRTDVLCARAQAKLTQGPCQSHPIVRFEPRLRRALAVPIEPSLHLLKVTATALDAALIRTPERRGAAGHAHLPALSSSAQHLGVASRKASAEPKFDAYTVRLCNFVVMGFAFRGELRCSNIPAREPENPIIMPPIVQHAPVVTDGTTGEAVVARLRAAALF